ncbi:cytochrome b and DOMON domain-containing protein [Tripterygium wilfordii]|uniref:Cytochrome b561 and DOMON domain-containing protein n=1 Tax=Tripterygium wilfordii TaxID=458696 RepID=A0A7J7C4I5_TRIWF|nr:cytochrome b561 and DOMON domain-containing protein At5g47530-like [Tripterygium wilfordii]KAF5728855.1 cytochrome b and DOMON domain-containing protein [Tripterygium wilfordii]
MLNHYLLCLSIALSLLFLPSNAQTCAKYSFPSNIKYTSCNDLPYLNSFLHWTYDNSTGKLQIAYRHGGLTSSDWVAWAINPTSTGMLGAQALVAYQKLDGTMTAYPAPVDTYQTTLQEGKLSFQVSELSATFANNEIIIYATLVLPGNTTTVNQVWQNGPLSPIGAPARHSVTGDNIQSSGTLNLLSGEETSGGNSKEKKKNIHGVLNTVGWGIMMPLGALIARYLKVFKSADPAWFYLHLGCQTSAYIIGTAGWATGLKLGSESPGVEQTPHRTIGILLFCLGTLQVFALLLRPKPEHKYRFYWNIYHHTVGYLVILLSVINIFKGFDILQPDNKWKNGYIVFIVLLAIKAVFLEAFTWYIVMKKKRSESDGKMTHNATNGASMFGGRHQQVEMG